MSGASGTQGADLNDKTSIDNTSRSIGNRGQGAPKMGPYLALHFTLKSYEDVGFRVGRSEILVGFKPAL